MTTPLSPDPLREALDARLGTQYAIESLLGRGGMGSVYRARDLTLDRPVAIKVIAGDVATHPELRDRFLLEARTVAKLRHPNLVAVYSAGDAGGLLYFVMELVPGESLRDLLAREGRVEPARAERILHEIALALDYAHANGVIHRDVKPENILLDGETGRAMLTDFGVARALEGDGRMTGTGMILGSPRYMSPEQASGDQTLDGRSDLYSLALVGYEMFSGRPVVDSSNVAGMLVKHLTETPRPVAEAAAGVSEGAAGAIDRALAKDRDARWTSGREMADAIGGGWTPSGATVGVSGGRITAPGTRRRPSQAMLVTAGIAAAVLVALAWAFRDVGGSADPRRSYAVVPFDIQSGNPDVQWLRDGAVNMLTLTLSQWDDLSIVDYERTLTLIRQAGFEERRVDLDGARDVARRARAGTLVMGQISTTADSLLVVARVYDVATGRPINTSTQTAAVTADPRPLFEELARYLLDIAGGTGAASVELARATTSSLTAYRAYLDGVRLLNSWRLTAADSAFRVAINADSTFALAWHRRAQALGWSAATDDDYLLSAERAMALADRLPPRIQALVRGHLALTRGLIAQLRTGEPSRPSLHEAQTIYRELLAQDSLIAEGWYGLGDATFHDIVESDSVAHISRMMTTSIRAFHRTLALDSTFHLAYSHLVQLYQQLTLPTHGFALDGDSVRFVASDEATQRAGGTAAVAAMRAATSARGLDLARGWVRADPDALLPYFTMANGFAAAGLADSSAAVLDQALARPALQTAPTRLVAATFQLLADQPRAFATMREATTRAAVPALRGTSPNERYSGMAAALSIAASVGNAGEIARLVDVFAEVEPVFLYGGRPTRDVYQWYVEALHLAMGAPLTAAAREVLLQGVRAFDVVDVGLARQLRGPAAAIPFTAYLATRDTVFSNTVRRWSAPGITHSDLDALEALTRGDTAAARASIANYPPPAELADARFAFSGLRTMARAEALAAVGDLDGALGYYEALDPSRFNMGSLTEPGFAMYTRSFAARARLYEQRGDTTAAARAWETFLRRTEAGDAIIAPQRRDAEAALARLRR